MEHAEKFVTNQYRVRRRTVEGALVGTLSQWAAHPEQVAVTMHQLIHGKVKTLAGRGKMADAYDWEHATLLCAYLSPLEHNCPVPFILGTNYVPKCQQSFVEQSMQSFREYANWKGPMAKVVIDAVPPGQPTYRVEDRIWLLEAAHYGPTTESFVATFKPLTENMIDRGIVTVGAEDAALYRIQDPKGGVWIPKWHVLSSGLHGRPNVLEVDGHFLTTHAHYTQMRQEALGVMKGLVDESNPADYQIYAAPAVGATWTEGASQDQHVEIRFTLTLTYLMYPKQLGDVLPNYHPDVQMPAAADTEANKRFHKEKIYENTDNTNMDIE